MKSVVPCLWSAGQTHLDCPYLHRPRGWFRKHLLTPRLDPANAYIYRTQTFAKRLYKRPVGHFPSWAGSREAKLSIILVDASIKIPLAIQTQCRTLTLVPIIHQGLQPLSCLLVMAQHINYRNTGLWLTVERYMRRLVYQLPAMSHSRLRSEAMDAMCRR
jgi:hypothetical protein